MHCTSHSDEVIKGTSKDGKIQYFDNGKEAARQIGCTSVLIYNTLNKNHWNKHAKGWALEWVKIADLPAGTTSKVSKTSLRNARFKIEFEDGRQPVEADYDEVLRITGLTRYTLRSRIIRGNFIKGIKITAI